MKSSIVFILCSFLIATTTGGNVRRVVPSRLTQTWLSRISGGNLAASQQFPWMVFISASGTGEESYCGGSILSSTWVLTAAHCTYNYLSLDLYFGSTDIYSMPEIMTSTYWIEHQNYNPATYNNDVSVVQLPSTLSFTSTIQPITLLSYSQAAGNFVDQVTAIMGFGYTSDSNPSVSDNLVYTNVIIVPNANCITYYGSSVVTPNTICAVGYSSAIQSICSGDSGGPMVINNGNNRYTQIGINSFISDAGCTSGHPSGYVRLGSYLTWISSYTGVIIGS